MVVTRVDRRQLEATISDRSAPQKHVWRAAIILATADGCGTAEIMRRCGKAKPVVWRWQARFMAEGVNGLTRDKTRKPGKPPLPSATVQRVYRGHVCSRIRAMVAFGIDLAIVYCEADGPPRLRRMDGRRQRPPHANQTFVLTRCPRTPRFRISTGRNAWEAARSAK